MRPRHARLDGPPRTAAAGRRLLAAAVFALVLAGCASPGSGKGTNGGATAASPATSSVRQGLSAVRHVWLIDLENRGYQQSFGIPSADPYLARTLPQRGP